MKESRTPGDGCPYEVGDGGALKAPSLTGGYGGAIFYKGGVYEKRTNHTEGGAAHHTYL